MQYLQTITNRLTCLERYADQATRVADAKQENEYYLNRLGRSDPFRGEFAICTRETEALYRAIEDLNEYRNQCNIATEIKKIKTRMMETNQEYERWFGSQSFYVRWTTWIYEWFGPIVPFNETAFK